MAKDGTLRGNSVGNPALAGGKRSPLVDKIAKGKERYAQVLDIPELPVEYLGDLEELEAEELPPFDTFMTVTQKNGIELCSKAIYKKTCEWLRKCGGLKYVNPVLIMQYSQLVARWIQTDLLLSEKGLLAKHATTGQPTTSPYVAQGLKYLSHANVAWGIIFAIVRENCSVKYSSITPQDEAMEMLLSMKG